MPEMRPMRDGAKKSLDCMKRLDAYLIPEPKRRLRDMKKTKEDPLRFYHSRMNCAKTNGTEAEAKAFEKKMA